MQPSRLGPAGVALAILGLFVAGGLLLLVGILRGRRDASALRRYALEGILVWGLALPALAGAPWLELAVLGLCATAAVELGRALFPARVAPAVLLAALVVAALAQAPALPAWLGLLGPLGLVVALRGPAVTAALVPAAAALALAGLGRASFGPLLFVFAVLETSDSFAYLVGRHFGRIQAFPRVSARKTVEGVGAALATGPIVAIAFDAPGTPAGWPARALLGLALSAAAVAADLATSALKRRLGRKDFAAWMPEHGSVLDAYDSLFVVAPLAWLALG